MAPKNDEQELRSIVDENTGKIKALCSLILDSAQTTETDKYGWAANIIREACDEMMEVAYPHRKRK